MTREKTKEEIIKEEKEKDTIATGAVIIGFILFAAIFIQNLAADEMVHKFKNPSFSGINTSSHYLTIENQEFNRKKALKEEIKALKEAAEREENNTTLARFIRNLESRIYAQLSSQLVNNLFGENAATSGEFSLLDTTVSYEIIDGIIYLKITDASGNVTEISLPVGDFYF
jgi:curli production assembly/transport component CsgF